MNRTVKVLTDKLLEIPGLGMFGPDDSTIETADGVVIGRTYLTEPKEYVGEVTDEQIIVWEAVNGRKWPEDGISVGYSVEVVETPTDQAELPFPVDNQNTAPEGNE